MLKVESDGTIQLTRGDTARLAVSITNDLDGSEYTMQEGDELTLTVKKAVTDAQPAFQKVLHGENKFHIEPKDTAGLAFGRYKYDVQLTLADGDVYTIIEPTVFELLKEVTC
jgi:hypothetical protein